MIHQGTQTDASFPSLPASILSDPTIALPALVDTIVIISMKGLRHFVCAAGSPVLIFIFTYEILRKLYNNHMYHNGGNMPESGRGQEAHRE